MAAYEQFAVDLMRVADRLRGVPFRKLEAPLPPYPTVAAAVHALTQRIADVSLAVEHRNATVPPWREVPDLGPVALGDQVAVLGRDLRGALADAPGEARIRTRTGDPATVDSELVALADDLRTIRSAL